MNSRRPEPRVLTPGPSGAEVSPVGFQTWATQFAQAARAIEVTTFSPVKYFLACRSIELALKAYLLACGSSKKYLRKRVGHNLCKAFRRARRRGFDACVAVTEDEERLIEDANKFYDSKLFEYFDVHEAGRGFSGRPEISSLLELAEKLASTIKDRCIAAAHES